MENKFQLLLYLIFGIIYVLSRIMKNRGKQAHDRTEPREDSLPGEPQVTFEDLLREFTNPKESSKPAQKHIEESYEFEHDKPSDQEIDEIYQRSVEQAVQYEETDATKLRHDVEYKRFEEFTVEEENQLLDEIAEDLSDGHTLKKAIIYKEILDRKY